MGATDHDGASDPDLVRRVLAGDRDAFHVLLDRHGPALWGTLRAAAGPDDAREVYQETWTRALERLAELREPGRLRAWLVSVALNLLRQRRRRPRAASLDAEPAGAGAAEPAADEPPVGAALEARELAARVRAAMAELPPRQREVVDLRVTHGLAHAEIARLLGIAEDASRASLYQGLRRLRARFPDLEP